MWRKICIRVVVKVRNDENVFFTDFSTLHHYKRMLKTFRDMLGAVLIFNDIKYLEMN